MVFIVTTVAAVIVIVVLLLRNHRGHWNTEKYNFMYFCFCESLVNEMVFLLYRGQMSAVDITTESNEAYGLTQISGEPTYE